MDNIGKLVVGVVAFIGLVVLLIPKGNPLENQGPPAVAEAPKNVPPATEGDDGAKADERAPGEAPAPPPAKPPVSAEAIAFGQPMMDPTPPGQKAVQQQVQQQPGGEGSPGGDANMGGPVNAAGGPPDYGAIPGYQYPSHPDSAGPSPIPNN